MKQNHGIHNTEGKAMIHNRPFDDTRHDFEKMWRFIQQDYAHKQDHFVWLFSRLGDWKYGLWNEKKYVPTKSGFTMS